MGRTSRATLLDRTIRQLSHQRLEIAMGSLDAVQRAAETATRLGMLSVGTHRSPAPWIPPDNHDTDWPPQSVRSYAAMDQEHQERLIAAQATGWEKETVETV